MNYPSHFRGMSICLVPYCFVSTLNILHLPKLHLPPSNPSFFVVLLLASGSRSFFSSFHVYYGYRRHVDSVLLPMSHASTFFCSLVIPHTKHRSAHIHQQSTYIYTHNFHVHISPFRASSIIPGSPMRRRMVYPTG